MDLKDTFKGGRVSIHVVGYGYDLDPNGHA